MKDSSEFIRRGYGAYAYMREAPITDALESLREWTRVSVDLLEGGVYHPFPLIERNQGLSGVQILLLWDDLKHLRKWNERNGVTCTCNRHDNGQCGSLDGECL